VEGEGLLVGLLGCCYQVMEALVVVVVLVGWRYRGDAELPEILLPVSSCMTSSWILFPHVMTLPLIVMLVQVRIQLKRMLTSATHRPSK